MATGANSYGSAANVAALTPRFTNSGVFDTTTRPTIAQVETWIDQTSGTVNIMLAEMGFVIPVTQADAVLSLASLVTSSCADRALYANQTGRFFTDAALEHGISIDKTLRNEIAAWVEAHAGGIEALGATRTNASAGSEIAYREADNAGDDVTPLFQRKAFGDVTRNWDS